MKVYSYFKRVMEGVKEIFTEKKVYKREMLVDQIYKYVSLSLPMLLLVSFFLGAVLIIQVMPELAKFGAEFIAGGMVAGALTKEIAPILISTIIAGRIGSAMASELGSMNISNQLDSLRLMAVDPIKYLAAPRILSSTLVLPFLTLLSLFIANFGSYLFAVYLYNIASGEFFESISRFLGPYDLFVCMVKTTVFGFIIAFISCYKGLFLKGRSVEIGDATTDAVAFSIVAILFVNLLLSIIMF